MPTTRIIHVGGDTSGVFNHPCFGPCFELEIVGSGVPLVTHLGDEFRVLRSHADEALALAKGMGELLFHEDVLIERHR